MVLTKARSGLARSGATRSGFPVLEGFKVRTYALSNVARSGATRSNYTSGKVFITVGGVTFPRTPTLRYPYRDQVIADGAIAYWRLGETSGTTARSEIGNYDGTISGGVILNQPGALADGDAAMRFDGSTGKIVTVANISLTPPVTIEVWIRNSVIDDRVIVSNVRLTGTNDLIFLGLSGTRVRLYVEHVSGGLLTNVFGTKNIADNQWHHVVAMFTTTTLTAYVDGVLDASGATTAALIGSTSKLEIGYVDEYGAPFAWPGLIDDVAIYPTALTAQQVANHYALASKPIATVPPPYDATGILIDSLTINDSLSSTPTTGTLAAYGWIPVEGADVVITLGSINNRRRDFGGTILRTKHRYVGDKPVARNMVYDCNLIDYAWGLQKRKFSGRYTAATVGAIAAALMTAAPAGYTLEVAPDLAATPIDEITFTEANLDDAIGQLVTRAGGDWQCDYLKVVRLFFTDTSYAAPSIVNAIHKSMAGMTWDRDLSQVVTRVYGDGGGSDALEAIPVGATMIPVGTAAWYNAAGGVVLAGPQRVQYASVALGGGGSLIGPGAAPSSAVNALVVPGTGVTAGTHGYAVTYRTPSGETIPSPVASVSVGVFAPPTSAPTAGAPTSAGPGPDPGTHEYAITFQVSTGETTPGPRVSASTGLTPPPTSGPTPTAGAVGAGPDPGTHDYAVSFVTPVGETTPGPIGGSITTASTPLPAPTMGPTTNLATAGGAVDQGDHYYAATFVTALGETIPSPQMKGFTGMGPGTKVPNPTNGPQCLPNTSHAGNSQPVGTVEYFCYSYLTSSGETLWSNYGNAVVGTYPGTGGPCAIDVTYLASPDSRVTSIAIYHSLNPGVTNSWIREVTVPNANGTQACGFYGTGGQNPPTVNTTPGTDGTPLQTIPLTAIPIGPSGTTARRIYRTPVGGGVLKLLTTLANNSTTTFSDTTADSALGVAPPSVNTAYVTTAVSLSDIPRGATGSGTTARNLYRRSGGAGLRFLDQIANNASSTYTDTKANAALGVAPPSTNTAYLQPIPLSAIPIGGSVVTGRNLYRTKIGSSTLFLLASLDNVVTTYLDTTPDAGLGVAAPATNAAAAAQVNLSAIPVGAPTVTARVIYRTAANASQLKLLTTIANNVDTTWTDTAADGVLGANAPTSDTSSLTQPQGNVLAGSTSIPCASIAAFPVGGGWVLAGSQAIRYTGISGNNLIGVPASGPGSVASPMSYNTTIVAAPTLLGIPASGVGAIKVPIIKGDAIDLFIQEDDVAAQSALAAQLGPPNDGIVEDEIQDRRLSEKEMRARARARLAQLAERDAEGKVGIVTVAYTCRDLNTRAGATVTINIGPPVNLRGDFLIQRVTINQFGVPHLNPTYTVEASSVRFTFEELLRVIKETAA